MVGVYRLPPHGPLSNLFLTNNVVNGDVWDSIPQDLQRILVEEGAKTELEQLRLTSIQSVVWVQKNIDTGMELVEFTPELAEYSLNTAAIEHVIPGWLGRLGYPGKNDDAVAMFNEHVGPYVGVSIGPDGSVRQDNPPNSPTTESPPSPWAVTSKASGPGKAGVVVVAGAGTGEVRTRRARLELQRWVRWVLTLGLWRN